MVLQPDDVFAQRTRIETAAASLRAVRDKQPSLALLLGTGHTEVSNRLDDREVVTVEEIPEFPRGSEGSAIVLGSHFGLDVIIADAPLAPYLGASGAELAFPVRVFRAMGVETLVLTAAAASLDPAVTAGDLAIVDDHLNFTTLNPLLGNNDDLLGPRFPDMTEPYDGELSELVRSVAADAGFPIHRGVLAAIRGPSLPTRAEYRLLRSSGADFVGMSTVPEVIAAAHAGLSVAALLAITQTVATPAPRPAEIERMVEAADLAAPRMATVLDGLLDRLARR